MWGGALALALLVPGVFADHHDVAVATNDFALVANRLDAGVDLHCVSPSSLASCPEFRAVPSARLLVAVNDASSREVVWAKFYNHFVLGEDSDVVLAHLARDVSEDLVAVRQFDPKHCIGQCFDDRTFDLDNAVFISHVSVRCCWLPHVVRAVKTRHGGHDTPKYENTR